ncbi:C2H2 type master regulator of conidiophore development brlA [Fusarium oxysporum f. sp. albedinis]|nr:C2H2 type master regulator of conidiophore development brlA [Fusarium oxysporum f. sp. albedinis]
MHVCLLSALERRRSCLEGYNVTIGAQLPNLTCHYSHLIPDTPILSSDRSLWSIRVWLARASKIRGKSISRGPVDASHGTCQILR